MLISNTCPPQRMTPLQRRQEVAEILAAGLLRLRQSPRAVEKSRPQESEFELGFLSKPSVHVDTVNHRKSEST